MGGRWSHEAALLSKFRAAAAWWAINADGDTSGHNTARVLRPRFSLERITSGQGTLQTVDDDDD